MLAPLRPKRWQSRAGLKQGINDALSNWWLVIRCSVIGAYIGMLPGLGASIVGWVTYGHAMQSAKDQSQFGQGDIRGVLAPEAANNALRGGALIPTVTMGIPGSVGTAVLMGALIMLGLRPGPSMLSENLDMTFSFVWMIAFASVIATIILLFTVEQVAKVALLPGHLVVPGVLLFVYMGAWLGGSSLGDWISCTAFGVLGFAMKRGGWPRPPVTSSAAPTCMSGSRRSGRCLRRPRVPNASMRSASARSRWAGQTIGS